MKVKRRTLSGRICSALLATTMASSVALVGAPNVFATTLNTIREHSVGVTGSFTDWGWENSDILMTDDDGDGVYDAYIYLPSVEKDWITDWSNNGENTGKQAIQFKVRLDHDWSDNWSRMDSYERVFDSQFNMGITDVNPGDSIVFRVFLDTTQNNPEAVAAGLPDYDDVPEYEYLYAGYDQLEILNRGDSEPKYGVAGSFTDWGNDSDIALYDTNGDGVYVGVIEGLEAGDYEFKVRQYNDSEWTYQWSAYEPEEDRTQNSQILSQISLTKTSDVIFTFDTTKVDPEAAANPDSYVNSSDFTDEDKINYYAVRSFTAEKSSGSYEPPRYYSPEEKILNELYGRIDINGEWVRLYDSYINQVENYLWTADITDKQADEVVWAIQELKSYLSEQGVYHYNDMSAEQILTVIELCRDILSPLDLSVSFDISERTIQIKDSDGNLVAWNYFEKADEIVSGFDYTLNTDGTCTINKYTGGEKDVTVPEKIKTADVTTIGDYSFAFEDNVTDVTIPETVTDISYKSFYYCSSLKEIDIPDSVKSIGESAFEKSGLTGKVHISDGVEFIGTKAFAWCEDLTNIEVDEKNSNYTSVDGVLFNKDKTQLIAYPAGKAGTYVVPATVKEICDSAFEGCEKLTDITIPDSVTKIGEYAFSDCTGLKEIKIPDSVTSIGRYAFFDAYKLESVVLSDNITGIDIGTFDDCSSLNNITIPDGVTEIREWAFFNCTSLKSVNIPDGVELIGDGVFGNCESLEEITIPDSIIELGWEVFYNCTSLKSVNIPDGVELIGDGVFGNCESLEEITIPGSVEVINSYAFYQCTSLKNVTIRNGVKEVNYKAFYECPKLTSVTIPSSVEYIDFCAFGYIEGELYDEEYDEYYYGNVPVDNFTIYGVKDTAAEEYAEDNGFKFVAIEETSAAVLGDISGDGKIDIADALIISRYDAGLVTLTKEQVVAADVNKDGKTDIADALMISRYDAGLISSFDKN